MRRRSFLALATMVAVHLAVPAAAQQPVQMPRVAFFSIGPPDDFRVQGFQRGLRELGYVQGRNISVEYVFTTLDRIPQHAAEIIARRPEVIVATATAPSLAAMRGTATIPIIAVAVTDPVGMGLAASLARPGRNVTGLSNMSEDLAGKRVDILKDLLPGISRFAVLTNPENPALPAHLAQTQAVARALGLQVEVFEARPGDDLERIVATIATSGSRVLNVLQDFTFINNRSRIAELTMKYRLPSLHTTREEVAAGALFAYGPNLQDIYRRSAYHLDKIVKGTKPADIPFEQPTLFELLVNLKTAKVLGIEFPPSILIRADEVIE